MGLFDRLSEGLSKSSRALSTKTRHIFRQKLTPETLQELEDVLISADLGVAASADMIASLSAQKLDAAFSETEIKTHLASLIAKRLAPAAQSLAITTRPFFILVSGVNGVGKTTTIGKLAQKYKMDGHKVLLVAGDTFRAAAREQLAIWGERAGVSVLMKETGDAAALAYEALTRAKAEQIDIIIMDTAGRLHSDDNFMAELAKIIRVVKKIDENAPHASLLVLDATTGQHALTQAQHFQKSAAIDGLIMTKLDGTARGGVLVALADKLKLPIYFIGVGEQADDLQIFDATKFAHALLDVPFEN